jgi:tetratricopeptide (TPR) repeat protein
VKRYFLLPALILLYVLLVITLSSYMIQKPFAEKVGYVPRPEVLRALSADQKQSTAAALMIKTLIYFGGLIEKANNRIYIPPDISGMRSMIESSVALDPYNMDAYYFAQAVTVWEPSEVRTTNELLKHGMLYRNWDWYLPSFVGFNYAYFLKDYQQAAFYYQRMAELTGADLPMRLAGRYLYEAGRTDLAIAYLSAMEKSARNDAIRKSLAIRLQAFKAVKQIESARDAYVQSFKKRPASIEQLIQKGLLQGRPADPYGGKFYIDPVGQVRSTSKFAFMGKKE